ncbi:MAG: hypothetical protein N2Z72_02330 [Bacteroidales bacterium]|nr:hypothetical protein [Bacteroidales bacterium]
MRTIGIFFCLIALLASAQQKKEINELNQLGNGFFIENKGQWPEEVLFLAKLKGLNVWITRQGVNLTFYQFIPNEESCVENVDEIEKTHGIVEYNEKGHRIWMRFDGNEWNNDVEKKGKLDGYYNYLIGQNSSKWARHVGLYKEIVLKNVYEGIDVKFYFDPENRIRYDFLIGEKGNAEEIIISLEGQESDTLVNGEIVLRTTLGDVFMGNMRSFVEGKEVPSMFRKRDIGKYGIDLNGYTQGMVALIDPLIYSTYLGGSGDDYCHHVFF